MAARSCAGPHNSRMTSSSLRPAVLGLLVMLAACAQDGGEASPTPPTSVSAVSPSPAAGTPAAPDASPTAPVAATQTGEASPAPTGGGPAPVVTPPTDILPPGSLTRVVVDGVRIRQQPSTTAAVVTTAAGGEVVYVTALGSGLGPVSAEGIEWYPVYFAPGWSQWPDTPETFSSGFAARGQGGTTFLELEAVTCPSADPDQPTLAAMTPWARLACYGNRELTISGYTGCPGGAAAGGCGGFAPGTFTPEWLAYPFSDFLRPSIPTIEQTLGFRINPETGLSQPAQDQYVVATGHFDDPASSSCVMAPDTGTGPEPAHPSAAVLFCREQFVFSSYE